MEFLTNIGFMKADTERLSALGKDLCGKLEHDEASLHRAGDLQRVHGMIFAGSDPEDLVLCEEDSGRWYLVEMDGDTITDFWEAEYIEGFNAEEIETLRTKGVYHDGAACYITGKMLKQEERFRGQEFEDSAVYAVDYENGSVTEVCCQLDYLEAASRIFD